MKLKVGIVLAVLIGMIASPSFAQPMLNFGIKGGLNLAKISVDPSDSGCCDSRVGAAVGAFVGVPITDMVSFQPEVLFSMKGAKFSDSGESAKLKINIIEIPLLLHANIPTSGMVKPFITVGPGLGLRMSAKFEFDGQSEDIKDEVESTDFSVILGGGVQVGRATIEARYDLGLKDLDKDNSSKAKTRTLSVLVGFGIGGN